MNNQTKTNCILFNEQKLPKIAHDILNKFQAYEVERSVNEHGTVIEYSHDAIPGWIFNNIQKELGEENELLRYVFPDFISIEHYLENRDSNVDRSSVPKPGQYMIPSPYVTPYLINATWHPQMTTLPSVSTNTDIASPYVTPYLINATWYPEMTTLPSANGDLPPRIDLPSPRHLEDYSHIESITHARAAPSIPYASVRDYTVYRSPPHKRRRTNDMDSRSGPSHGSRHDLPQSRNTSRRPMHQGVPFRFGNSSLGDTSNYGIRGSQVFVERSRRLSSSQTIADSHRQSPTSTITTHSGVSPSRRFTYHSPRGASNSQDFADSRRQRATSTSTSLSSDMSRNATSQRAHRHSGNPYNRYQSYPRPRDYGKEENYRYNSRYNPKR